MTLDQSDPKSQLAILRYGARWTLERGAPLDRADQIEQDANTLCSDPRERLGADDQDNQATQLLGRAALLRSNAAATKAL